MARFLFATQPITGHVLPALTMVRSLVQRGHEVVWYVGERFRKRVEAAGARFAPYQRAKDYDDSDYNLAFPERARLKGLDQIKYDFINIFMKQIGPQHHDLVDILRNFPADVIVGDPSIGAAFTVSETGGPPNAVYNITCLGIKGRDVAPFGLGILPDPSLAGQLQRRLFYFLAPNVIFKAVSDEMNRQVISVGARSRKFEGVLISPYLFLQPSVPSFEYPRSDLPPQVHYLGALLPEPPASFDPPSWWPEVVQKRRPVVLVTQGTVATDTEQLVAPTLMALSDLDVAVVAAGVRDPASLGVAIPANAHIEAFVPFRPLMPHVDIYVTNGGFGGVMTALSHGVPIVGGGITEDKPEITNRIAYSGVGINLKTATPTADQVRAAIQDMLKNPGYRQAAQRIQADLARLDGPTRAAELLEELARTRKPVLAQGMPQAVLA